MKIATGLLLPALLLLTTPAAAAPCPTDCGHRGTGKSGAGAPYPENTIPSFEQAVAEGAQMVELDVIHSADGVLVVIHDDTVDRTTDGTGCVGDMTVAELQSLDAGFSTALEGQGVVIPTLAEVLAAVAVPVNVELKIDDGGACPPSDKPRMAADLIAVVEAAGARDRVVASSFDDEVLSELKALAPHFYAGYLTLAPTASQLAADLGFDAINLSRALIDQSAVDAARALGLQVNVWTVNDPVEMEELVTFAVDSIITDDPDVLATVQAQSCPAAPTPSGGGSLGSEEGGCSLSAGGPASSSTAVWLLGLLAAALAGLRRRR